MKSGTRLLLRAELALMLILASAACRDVDIEENRNEDHYTFILDTPPDGATEVNPRVLLHWSIYNMMQSVDAAQLFFGAAPNPPFLKWASVSDHGYHRPGPLATNTTYHWRLAVPTSSATASSPVQSFTVGRDRAVWTYALPPGQSVYDVNGTPKVLGNRIFQWIEGAYYCLDAASGTLLWTFDFSQATTARKNPQALERVYCSRGKIYCLDSATGAVQWTSFPPSKTGYGQPLVLGDRLFAHSNDRISCLDAATGNEIWGTNRVLCTTLDAAGGRVFVTTNTSVYYDGWTLLECLDAETGSLLWSRDFGTRFPPPRNPAAAGSRVYVTCADRLYCLDAASGATVWEYVALERAANPFLFADRVLLSEGQDRYVLLDAGSGTPLWRTTLIKSSYQHYTELNGDPVLLGDAIILADMSGYVYGIDAETGAIRWHHFVSTDMLGIAGWADRVYVTGDDEILYCLDTKE